MVTLLKRAAVALLALVALAAAAVAQPSPGPGPTPSPWYLNGNQVYLIGGQCVTLPAVIAGGCEGPNTINAAGLFVNGLAVPTTSTFSATSPITYNSGTGVFACPTCVTSTSGGALTGTSPISASASAVISIATATNTTLGAASGDNTTLSVTAGAFAVNLAHANTWTATQTLSINQNGGTFWTATNTTVGTASVAGLSATSDTASGSFGAASSGHSNAVIQNRVFVSSSAGGVGINAASANPVVFGIGGAEVGRWSSSTLGALVAGVAGSTVGQFCTANATSGTICLSPPTGALGAAVLTLPDVTDTLAGKALANGGTNASLVASNGGIIYSTASAMAVLAGTVTANQCLLSGSSAAPSWGSCSGGAAVTSVTNSDGTLTISPTTGAVVASIALGHANTWTGAQSFNSGQHKLNGATSGTTTVNAAAVAGATTQTFQGTTGTVADLDVADQTVSGGANVTTQTLTTGNVTIDCGTRPIQQITNGGAFTITAPANDGSCILKVTNNATAGAITFSGFTVGANTGSPLTTTNGNVFTISIWRAGGTSAYNIYAQQ